MSEFVESVWEGDGIAARLARAALSPASALFATLVARRNARFDAAIRTSSGKLVRPTLLPAVSIGNLTVGGTGKTPVAAWCVQRLIKAGAHPAVVLRGYGDDEWRVHSLLNRGVPVIVAPDRLNGIALAAARGANCVVLDDAFQHRQAARLVDIVLVSADRWTGQARLLPSGPFREPLSSLQRANVVVLTAKAAGDSQIAALELAVLAAAPRSEVAVIRLSLGALRLATTLPTVEADGRMQPRKIEGAALLDRPLQWLSKRTLVAVCAIGDPTAFRMQLESNGANVTVKRFPDHHAFSAAEAERIVRDAEGTDGVVCTLKDAVKLAPLWPRVAPPLWYVSQSVVVERGAPALDRALARVLAVRVATASNAG
ncbi:MAG: tetraacyldisaccharide 4'-kinase [Gemmatimonadota bacterium]|nr:tetraacyldisaccharide 4'-kinase [Gemmatimonadota bacterium]